MTIRKYLRIISKENYKNDKFTIETIRSTTPAVRQSPQKQNAVWMKM